MVLCVYIYAFFRNLYCSILYMYGNCDAFTNGEILLWETIRPFAQVMFDVGTRCDDYYVRGSPDTIQFHLFEPHPHFFAIILANTAYRHNVVANNVGLGSTAGQLQYYERAESFVNRWNEPTSKVLEVTTLFQYMNEKGVDNVDFVKIDTEGFELDVLQGAQTYLRKFKHIQFEYGGTYPDRGITQKQVFDLLQSNGFTIFLLTGNGLIRKDLPEEHCQYSNYLATQCLGEVTSIIL